MNILHVVVSVGKKSGGLGPAVLGLAQAQRDLGVQTTIWCLDFGDEALEVAGDWGLADSIVVWERSGPAQLGFSRNVLGAALSNAGSRYDLIHQHGIWLGISYIVNQWRRKFSRPTVVAAHGALDGYARRRSRFKKWLAWQLYENENMRSAVCLQALAMSEAWCFREVGLSNPVAVIPNGVPEHWLKSQGDGDKFRYQFGIPTDKRMLLFLSRIERKKGLPMLIEAISHMRDQFNNWLLVIAGPNERGHQYEIERLIDRLNVGEMIQFVGPLYGSDKLNAFAAADLFVLPTYSEGAPVAVLEALGAGVPVLTTRGAPCEDLVKYKCGWWVEVSVNGIQEALMDAFQRSASELRAMGQNGISLVMDKYTWPVVARQTPDLYLWLLGNAGRPGFVTPGITRGDS